MDYNGAAMPEEQQVMESYAILLGGGLVILSLLIFAKPAPRSFFLNSTPCDPRGVMDWLHRKLNQGKITADDIQRLLNTPITFGDWIRTISGQRGFTVQDVTELIVSGVCGGSPAVAHGSPCPCPPFCP